MKPWRGMKWKTLARHSLSAEYPNLGAKSRERALLLFQRHGYVGDDPILLAPDEANGGEIRVFDGWQRQGLCVETDTEPVYALLGENDPPLEDLVEIFNDCRRHEDPVARKKRADERLGRVAAARIAGDSIRTIAKREEVSHTTVKKDLEKAAGVNPVTPEPASGKISGSDGRSYPAPKPKNPDWCDRCARMGKQAKDCPACKEKRTGKPAQPDEGKAEKRGPGRPKKVYTWTEALDHAAALMRTFDGLCPPKKELAQEIGEEVERVRGMIFDVHDSMFKLSRRK